MAKKDPAFLFYPQDFLTGVTFMNFHQRGVYITMLCAQHQMGGFIEENSFNSMVGDDQLLKSKFIKCEHGYFNERLMKEMELREKKSTNISSAMKEVWNNRKAKLIESYNDPKRILSENERKLLAIEDVNEDENVIVNKNELNTIKSEKKSKIDYSPEFEAVWLLYDKKGSKTESYKVYKTLSNEVKSILPTRIGIYIANKPDRQFRKDLERYLKQGIYESKESTEKITVVATMKSNFNQPVQSQYREYKEFSGHGE